MIGGALVGVGMPNEEPVFPSDGRGPDRVFDEVIVEARRVNECSSCATSTSQWSRSAAPSPIRPPPVAASASAGKAFLPQRGKGAADLAPLTFQLIES
jgi:hypothetical protein